MQLPAAFDHAQEKPPRGVQAEADAWLPMPSPEELDEKQDINFSVFLPPQDGQAAFFSSSLLRQRNSKFSPHFLHLNS